MLYFTKLFLTSIFIINVETVIASEAKTGLPQLDLNTYPSLMFWSIISLILGFVLMKYLVTPNIKSILNSRETSIQNDLVKAKTSNQESEKIKQSIIKSQEDIKSKSQKIISDAILESKQSIEKKEKEISEKLELKVSEAEQKIIDTQNTVINDVINVETVIASEAKTGLPQIDLNTYPSLMFWSINSLILGFVLMKYLLTPNIKSILNSRETSIQNDLVKAKTSNQESEKIRQLIIKSQEDIKSKSQKIISDAILESKQSIEKKEKEISEKLELKVSEAEQKIIDTQNTVINDVINVAEEITADVVRKFTDIKYDKSNVKKAIKLASNNVLMEK